VYILYLTPGLSLSARQIHSEPTDVFRGKSAVCGLNGLRPTLRVGALHLDPRPRSALLLLRPLSVGRFASLRFRPKNMAHHIFQLESELQNIPEAAPEASRSFSVSEKLAHYGSSALSGVEHLTLLVGKKSIALALIRHFGSLKGLARASFQELRQFLPRRQAESVVAALSISVIAETEHARSEQLDNPESIYRACADMKLFTQEVLRVILLDTRYRHSSTVEITKGSINESLAYPRDIFRPVIGQSAYAFVLVHNHPSGDPAPSEADIRLTRRLAEGARVLQINMLDHVVVGQSFGGRPGYFSFKEAGML
jgi:DNA repair protein RadC